MQFNKKELKIISSCLYYRLQLSPVSFIEKYHETEEQKKYEKDIIELHLKIKKIRD